MTSETATMRLPPGPRHACRGLREASGLRRPTAHFTPRHRGPHGLACEKCLAANFQGLPPFDLRAHTRPQGFQKDAW